MPKVQVIQNSTLSPKDAFDRVTKFLENDSDLKKLDPNYTCSFNAGAQTGTAKGKLFSAKIAVKASAEGSNVEIIIDLPMTLALAKGMVQKTLQKKLDQSLA